MVPMVLVSKALPTLNGTKVVAAQLYPTLCDPKDYSPPGSSVHGILQATILEPFPFLEDLLDTRIKPRSPALQLDSLSSEPPAKFLSMRLTCIN